MSFDPMHIFTRTGLEAALQKLADIYSRQTPHSALAELVITGSGAVLLNYGFRNIHSYIDAILCGQASLGSAVRETAHSLRLPEEWMNLDFPTSHPYSPEMLRYAVHHHIYSNVLIVKTLRAEYLIAANLRSARKYQSDFPDIIGIMAAHEQAGNPITMDQIDNAVMKLYGSWDMIPKVSKRFLQDLTDAGHYTELYARITSWEKRISGIQIDFSRPALGASFNGDVNEALRQIQIHHESRTDLLERLQAM